MAKIFLLRIGETRANLDGKLSNFSPLTEDGIGQAYRARDFLKYYELAAVFSSEIDSAIKTAEIVAEPHGLKLEKCKEFDEINLGVWDGMTKSSIAEQYPEGWQSFLANPTNDDRMIPSGETFQEVADRVMPKLEILSQKFDPTTICIVAHGFVNRLIMCSLLGLQLTDVWKFDQFNTAINMFDYSSGKVKFQGINWTGHLYDAGEVKINADSITGKPWALKALGHHA